MDVYQATQEAKRLSIHHPDCAFTVYREPTAGELGLMEWVYAVRDRPRAGEYRFCTFINGSRQDEDATKYILT